MPFNYECKIDKGWGYELIFASYDLYCGIIMVFIKLGAKFQEMSELKVIQKTAKALSQGKAIGWFQGKM